MREKIVYVSDDGTSFDRKSECLAYEAEAEEVSEIIGKLQPAPESFEFSNGEGYVQHDPSVYTWVRVELLKVAKRHNVNVSLSGKGHTVESRFIDDMGIKYLRKAWYRIKCTDESFREWDQPYFAAHPYEGKKVRLNK
jgi:hypothetical protein